MDDQDLIKYKWGLKSTPYDTYPSKQFSHQHIANFIPHCSSLIAHSNINIMPKLSSKNSVVIGFIVFILVIIALFVGLFLVKQNQDIRQQASQGPTQQPTECVKAGCYNQACVSRQVDRTMISSVCDYQPQFACYTNIECKIQPDGKCGFSPSLELEKCLTDASQPSASPIADNCNRDQNNNVLCLQWDPAPGFCKNGTLIPSPLNECGCSMPPTCKLDNCPSSCNYISNPEACVNGHEETVIDRCNCNMPLCMQKADWNTGYVSLKADTIYWKNDDNSRYHLISESCTFRSDPGDDTYQSLEVTCPDFGMNIYFHSDGQKWWTKEIRTSSPELKDWVMFTDDQPIIQANKNQTFSTTNFSLTSDDGKATLIIKNLNLQAFLPHSYPISEYGYYLEHKPLYPIQMGISSGGGGYGINVLLKDKDGNIIKNQSSINYNWIVADTSIAAVTPNSTYIGSSDNPSGCSYGVNLPCPFSNGLITGLKPGKTTITVEAYDSSVQHIIATSEKFQVEIVGESTIYCDNGICPSGYQCVTPPKDCGTDDQGNPLACAFRPYCKQNNQAPSADINKDGKVDIDDYSILKQELMKQLSSYKADLNNDNLVDLDDYTILKSQLSLF